MPSLCFICLPSVDLSQPPYLRLKWLILLLWTITYCASCASLPETCVQCSLRFDEAPELMKHQSVIVTTNPPLKDPEKVYDVSSLYDGERCSVPGCFWSNTLYALQIYANNNDTVPELLVDKPNLLPDCDPNGILGRKNPGGADRKISSKLLILLAFCFWLSL